MSKLASILRAPPLMALGFVAALSLAPPQARAAAGGPFQKFMGEWTGAGQVISRNGTREAIRCRAEFSGAQDGEALNQTIVCASPSYRIDIQSSAEAVGDSVHGAWREETRNVSGQLSGRVADGRFVGAVRGSGFTAGVSLNSNGRRQGVNIEPSGGNIADVSIELERRG